MCIELSKVKNYLMMFSLLLCMVGMQSVYAASSKARSTENFNKAWKFHLSDVQNGQAVNLDDSNWRTLNLPHDWSVEGSFNKDNPATPGGGALPGGIGWYRKSFPISEKEKDKLIFIEFGGVYRNSEVWINGQYLGKRPYGYSSFRYELTPFIKFGKEKNIIAVKVDNSQQPNSRWYSGSGIYRNVKLVITEKVCVDNWGTYLTTPEVTEKAAKVELKIKVRNAFNKEQNAIVKTEIIDSKGKVVAVGKSEVTIAKESVNETAQTFSVAEPILWSVDNPYLYKAVTTIEKDGKVLDNYQTPFGIRTFEFDVNKGFILNGKSIKINGVCNHHDLGFLGAAINTRALERQIEIMKEMGVNGIRTSHNPPAPELLDLCDKMGIIVMDEAFDMWKMNKTDFDYALDWDAWHKRDLEDMVVRDRNHPSVFIWSIGNEINEQWDTTGVGGPMTRELVDIVKNLDKTRPVTSNLNNPQPKNVLYQSGALDLVGFSYHHKDFAEFPKNFPGQKFIASETTSAIATRGSYDMPSDSVRVWPISWDKPNVGCNPDFTCSAYDNCRVPWGSTHEESLKLIKKYDFLSGMFIWTGFDYLGEPTPYDWPARSSYFGIVDLCGFPKDAFYLYQSEWTNKPVLHIFPHWNWTEGKKIDVWAYTNCDEVELFLNGKSCGVQKKDGEDLHLKWSLTYTPGTLKAVGKKNGKIILTQEIKTAGSAARIVLEADRKKIAADGSDLSFVTVKILDKDGNLIPRADNLVKFKISGEGSIAGVDNGLQTSMESFKADFRKAFNGMCLAVVQSKEKPGRIVLSASSEGLKGAEIEIQSK